MSSTAESVPARRWIVVAVVAAVVVVAAIVFVATRGSSDDDDPAAATGTSSSTAHAGASSATATEAAPSATTAPATATPPATSPGATPSARTTTGPRATAAPGARPTEPPVPLKETATPTKGVTAQLAKIESVTGVAEVPGDVGGPSLRVTVEIMNGTDAAVDLTGAVVVLYQGEERAPAIELTEPGGRPLPASVAAGKSVTGVYVFNVPVAERNPVEVEVDLAAKVPVVVFRGDARPFG